MIRSLSIKGYRGLDQFTLDGLGRVNLLVGTNNSGKTSILEAILLLASRGDPYALWESLTNRGERVADDRERRRTNPECEVCHVFAGHVLDFGVELSVHAQAERIAWGVVCEVIESKRQGELFDDIEGFAGPLAILLRTDPDPDGESEGTVLELTSRGTLPLRSIRRANGRPTGAEDAPRVEFVRTESLSPSEAGAFWKEIALTPEEDLITLALKSLDSRLERIAFIGGEHYGHRGEDRRGGFVVKLSGSRQPIPIGSLGDGIWRILGLALAGIRARGGVLLVDEIDTGLHYTVMRDMWTFIADLSRKFDVQVFATTHSYDCVRSLSSICRSDVDVESDVSIQRIEPEAGKAVAFTEPEIIAAAEHGIEVR